MATTKRKTSAPKAEEAKNEVIDSTAIEVDIKAPHPEEEISHEDKVRNEILGYLFKKYNVPESVSVEEVKNLYDSIASVIATYAAEDDKEFIPEIILTAADAGAAQFLRLYAKRAMKLKTPESRISRINERTNERLKRREERNKKFSERLNTRRNKRIERVKATMS